MPELPSEILNRNKETIKQVVSTHGCLNPRVFGSVARGEDKPGSDIDLLVTPTKGNARGFVNLSSDLAQLLGIKVDVLSDRWLSEQHAGILAEAVAL
jgi:predicted nucleotidyltransferase